MLLMTQHPDFLDELRTQVPAPYLGIIDKVWRERDQYLRWPKRSHLFMPGTVRQSYHRYDPAQISQLKAAGITRNTLSNGPA
ncbi:MAG: hypothetical protein LC774_05385, partial [Acidobacteria bacterium]|nr:hypothetical protein [Acidobacteriota bacterium]